MTRKKIVLTVALVLAAAVTAGAWHFRYLVLPSDWSAEPARLAEVLGVRAGATIADIGAGDGSLAVAMARSVGPTGQVYATELDPGALESIRDRVASAGAANVRVIAAAERATNLPDACCDAIYLRTVFHHLDDQPHFAREIAKALKPGGRVAIIDFAPGSVWFLAGDHGVTQETTIDAFTAAGLSVTQRIEDWNGGMYLLRFEWTRAHAPPQP